MVPRGTPTVARGKQRTAKRVAKKALKIEEEQLRDYELVLIVSPEVDEDKFEATLNNISQFIAGKNGVTSDVERWGKRRLAYPIEHFMEGNYVLIRFRLQPALSKELEAKLRISEEVLRYLLINLSG